ncbi:MAG: tyrosine--tRNA ligase [Saprospiraceae bacterium]|nr:tyrosine--tRNA ligase [Saprospiraceae bacterium]
MASTGFIEELKWRGMLHDSTPGVEEHLAGGVRRGYIGFDPTARSLTIGNYVQIMILTLFQRAGHQPIVLMGGATGRIGDPSGKDAERDLLSYELLDQNIARQRAQFEHLLNFREGDNRAMMLDNLDFYRHMNALDFLRDAGKNLTVSYMLSKESVKKRLETGLSYTEFSYQVLQAYDFLCLYREQDCTLQMGGSDQWGNITAGIEFVRRNTDGKVYAVTTPLLTKTDGSKFGKSEAGNIWLDAEMTSPYQFYQFWINADDRDLSRFLRFFSLKSRDEIEAMEAQIESDPRAVKQQLGEELTVRVHSREAYESVEQVSQILFNPKVSPVVVQSMRPDALAMITEEITSFEVPRQVLSEGVDIVELLSTHTAICQSKGDARRSVQSNAVSVNKVKVASIEEVVRDEQLIRDMYLLLENGKKNKYMVRVVD